MNGLVKRLFIPNSPVAWSTRLKVREGPADLGSNRRVLQKFCLNFHKMNRCHYLLVLTSVIQLFPNATDYLYLYNLRWPSYQ